MSENPAKAVKEVIDVLDEATGNWPGPCSGWLKRAPMDEVLNWLNNNLRPRLVTVSRQVLDMEDALRSLCDEVGERLTTGQDETNTIEGDATRIVMALNKAERILEND